MTVAMALLVLGVLLACSPSRASMVPATTVGGRQLPVERAGPGPQPIVPSATVEQSTPVSASTAPTTPASSTSGNLDAPAQAAVAAAERLLNAVLTPTNQPCNRGDGRSCLYYQPDWANPATGIAAFGISDGYGGAAVYLGLTPAGEWQFWLATQNIVYQQMRLPGLVRVCAEGDRLNVRAAPDTSATIVGQLNSHEVILAERFVLTEPGQPATTNQPGRAGAGWYAVTGRIAGWAYSRFLAAAERGDCQDRDLVEKGR
jgi:hypothetical protein